MVFGFGGSKDSSSSSSSSSSSDLSSLAGYSTPLPSTSPSPSSSDSSSDVKNRLTSSITMHSNLINAKYLISKVNENCFAHCVPTPGSSLSSREQTCLSSCMEKYIEAWNTVSKTYVGRLQKEGAHLGSMTG